MPNPKPNEVKGIFPLTSVVTGASWLILTFLSYVDKGPFRRWYGGGRGKETDFQI